MTIRKAPSKQTQIQAEMIALAFEHLQLSSLAVIINASVLSMALWGIIDHDVILVWAIAMLSISLFRHHSAYRFRHHKEQYTDAQWKLVFLAGVIISALIWASASIYLFAPDSLMHQAMLVIVLGGMSAGAVSSLSSVLPAIWSFLVLLLVPITIRLLAQDTSIHNWVALLITLFLIITLMISRRFHDNNRDAIRSRLMYEAAKAELDITSDRFETIFREAPAGIFLYDVDLKIIEINQDLADILDAPFDFLQGLSLTQLQDKRILPSVKSVLDKISGFYEGEYRSTYAQKEIWISMRTSPLLDADRKVIGGIAIVTDITERMDDQKKIQHQAHYDALTNVPNRALLKERIQQEIARYKRHKVIAGLLFLDLDHFKNINDSLGHQIGDQLLIQAADRLQSILREEDTVARLGGDEFVILLPELGDEPIPAIRKTEIIAQKVHRVFSVPFDLQGHELSTSTSIGLVITDEDNIITEDLLKHADMAMYQAKKEGRSSTSFYRPEMDRTIKRRLLIDNALRNAIFAEELQIYFQPIIEITTGDIIGAETLLRWENPGLGSVTPDEFIPIAEESGNIVAIGEWVLEEACLRFAQWQREVGPDSPLQKIAVNVSSKQFDEASFIDKVLNAITQSGIRPDQLELELTESIIIDNLDNVSEKMRLLRSHHIGISIDDFGTGYSSLSYLKRLPFTTLKIDKSFTQDIQTDADDAELIHTIITIAKSFEMDVIAEGVETAEQYAFLSENQCHYFQGYLCAPALPNQQFVDMLERVHGKCETIKTM